MAEKNLKNNASRAGGAVINLGSLNPKQEKFLKSKALYCAYGGARGGGKSHAMRIDGIQGALKYPGIKILMVRRTYNELTANLIDPMLKLLPNSVAEYNTQTHSLRFINGSTIKFGHFQSYQAAFTEYQGQEYDWIFIDEATQFTEEEFRLLGGCLRGVNDFPKKFRLSCNPGGIGHRWVKRLFIDRDFKTGCENPEEDENPKDYEFIFASVEDNEPLMKSSPAYVQMLSSLPENIRRAHRFGDWDALGGSYFPEFSQAHIIKPFAIPAHWTRYRAFDYGLDMFACLWVAVDESGRSYVYRELQAPGKVVSEAAALALENTGVTERVAVTFAPPDMWNRQKDTGKSMAELFMLNELPIIKANNNRVQGWLQVKEFLKTGSDGKPGLMIFDGCKGLIDCLKAIQTDDTNPNDCAKEPHDITHICDALRYYCISRTLPSEALRALEERDEFDEIEEDYETYMTGGDASAGYIGY